jgi:hypothetical protein
MMEDDGMKKGMDMDDGMGNMKEDDDDDSAKMDM